MNKKQIKITCQGADSLPYEAFQDFQGSLKKISKKNLQKLKKQILDKGFCAPIFVWKRKNNYFTLDGHQRLKALGSFKSDGYEIPTLPVVYIDAKNEADARAKLLAISSSYGDFELEELTSWLEGFDEEMREDYRFLDKEIDIRIPGEETEGDDEFEEEVKPVTKLGDLWELGSHRVLCGDSTDAEQVEKLVDGKKADIVFTDPPYGVSIGDKNKFLNTVQKSGRNLRDIKDDSKKPEELFKELLKSFENLKTILNDCCSVFVTSPQGGGLGMMMMMMMMKEAGLEVRHVLIWKKNGPTFSMGRLDYDYKHEPILLTWHKKHKFYGNGPQRSSVWEYDKPMKSKEHPTMKPVELVENALLNNSDKNNLCVDIYLGSGTTLIAAEKIGRICYGMEIEPHYCDVIVNRYLDWCEKNGRTINIKLNGKAYQR